MSNKELLFETKYGKMTGYKIFVKYCKTRDWALVDEVMHENSMCINEIAILIKEELKQRSIDGKTRGFELIYRKEIFDSEDVLNFSYPSKGD